MSESLQPIQVEKERIEESERDMADFQTVQAKSTPNEAEQNPYEKQTSWIQIDVESKEEKTFKNQTLHRQTKLRCMKIHQNQANQQAIVQLRLDQINSEWLSQWVASLTDHSQLAVAQIDWGENTAKKME